MTRTQGMISLRRTKGDAGVVGRTSKERNGPMKTFTLAMAFTRKLIGRRAVDFKMVGLHRSAIHTE